MSTPEILTLIVSSLTMMLVTIIGFMWRRECGHIDDLGEKVDKLRDDVADVKTDLKGLNGDLRNHCVSTVAAAIKQQRKDCRRRERELEEVSGVRAHPAPYMVED